MAKKTGERQQLEGGDIAGLSFTSKKTKPTTSLPVTSYRLPPELTEAVKQIAEDLGVSPADVARVLMSKGLEEYKAGRLDLIPKPKKYELE